MHPGAHPVPVCFPPATESDTAQAPGQSEEAPGARPHSPSPAHGLPSPGGMPKAPLGGDTLRPKEPLAPSVYPDKSRGPGGEGGPPPKRSANLLGSLPAPLPMQPKEGPAGLNGRSKPWDSFTPEEFAQQFHESVLQSTQKALQKHKGTVGSYP